MVMKSMREAAIVIAPTNFSEMAASGDGTVVSFGGEDVISIWHGAFQIHHFAP